MVVGFVIDGIAAQASVLEFFELPEELKKRRKQVGQRGAAANSAWSVPVAAVLG